MEIVVNACYGGFGLSDEFRKAYPGLGCSRTDPDFISALREFGLNKASGSFARLAIASIPEEATDYEISDYDGVEHIIYVLNGKICHAYA